LFSIPAIYRISQRYYYFLITKKPRWKQPGLEDRVTLSSVIPRRCIQGSHRRHQYLDVSVRDIDPIERDMICPGGQRGCWAWCTNLVCFWLVLAYHRINHHTTLRTPRRPRRLAEVSCYALFNGMAASKPTASRSTLAGNNHVYGTSIVYLPPLFSTSCFCAVNQYVLGRF